MKLTRAYKLLASVALCTSALLAQSEPAPPAPAKMMAHRMARLTTLLSLTGAQQSQASTLFASERTSLSALRENMRAAHKTLKTAIRSNDTATIGAQAQAIGSLTTQETEARATAAAAFYALLTPEQQAKYQQLEEDHEGPRGHRPPRPFGPGL